MAWISRDGRNEYVKIGKPVRTLQLPRQHDCRPGSRPVPSPWTSWGVLVEPLSPRRQASNAGLSTTTPRSIVARAVGFTISDERDQTVRVCYGAADPGDQNQWYHGRAYDAPNHTTAGLCEWKMDNGGLVGTIAPAQPSSTQTCQHWPSGTGATGQVNFVGVWTTWITNRRVTPGEIQAKVGILLMMYLFRASIREDDHAGERRSTIKALKPIIGVNNICKMC